jgi:hypothetical protein
VYGKLAVERSGDTIVGGVSPVGLGGEYAVPMCGWHHYFWGGQVESGGGCVQLSVGAEGIPAFMGFGGPFEIECSVGPGVV